MKYDLSQRSFHLVSLYTEDTRQNLVFKGFSFMVLM